MKKTAISLLLVVAMVLCVMLVAAPQAQAVTIPDSPCTGDHTGWTKLTAAHGNTTLASGNYYLDDASEVTTLAKRIAIGNGTTVNICLNGQKLTSSAAASSTDSRIFLFTSGSSTATLTICDCQGGGEIVTACEKEGGVVQMNNSATTELNLYDGVTLKNTATNAGGYGTVINMATKSDEKTQTLNVYNATITSTSKGTTGGVIRVGASGAKNSAKMNMYGGTVSGGSASQFGGNIAVYGTLTMYSGAKVTEGKDAVGANIWVHGDGTLDIQSGAIVDGAIYYRKANLLQLVGDLTVDKMNVGAAVRTDMTIDLNGHDLTTTISNSYYETAAYNVYVVDTANDEFDATKCGTLTYTVDGEGITMANIESGAGSQVAAAGNKRYVAIKDGDSYTIHRIYIGIVNVGLYQNDESDKVGMSYSTNFKADETVLDMLTAYGFSVKLGDAGTPKDMSKTTAADGFQPYLTVAVNNILSSDTTETNEERFNAKLYASTYITLDMGGSEPVVINSNQYAISLADVYAAVAAKAEDPGMPAAAVAIKEYIDTKYAAVLPTA